MDRDQDRAVLMLHCIVILDVFVYSLSIPYFPRILEGAMTDDTWLLCQSLSNFCAVVSGFCSGYLSDLYGKTMLLLLSQGLSLVCATLIAIGSIDPTEQSFATLLLVGYVLRRMNRTNPLATALMADMTGDSGQRKARLARLGACFGLGFALGPALGGMLSKVVEVKTMFKCGVAVVMSNIVMTASLQMRGMSGSSCVGVEEPKAVPSDQLTLALFIKICRTSSRTFAVHFLSTIAQFCYISSIGLAVRQRYELGPADYGMLISFFGISYSISLYAVIPAIYKYNLISMDKRMLQFGLGITAVSRCLVAFYAVSMPQLYVIHAFISIGTAACNNTITNLVTHAGDEHGK